MNKIVSSVSAACLLVCALAQPVFSAQTTSGIVVTPVAENVTVYTVSPVASPPAEVVNEAPAVAPVYITIVFCHPDWRRWHYERALGQRYTGFIKMYSGNPYPF